MMQRIITLLTDFSEKDGYPASMKGVILSINPNVKIVDITHEIPSHDIKEAAFVLKSTYNYFPRGTIHIAIVDPEVGSKRKPILVETENYYFICPDNGILSYVLLEEKIRKIIWINNKQYFLKKISNTFHGRDIFAPVGAYLSKGIKVEKFGKKINKIVKFNIKYPKEKNNYLIGDVIHIDKFGNIITNITREKFYAFTKNKEFEIKINRKIIRKISNSYKDVQKGELLAIFGSSEFLEISIREGNAFKLYGKPKILVKITSN
jgi:S-adenosylmethionine hydrolase